MSLDVRKQVELQRFVLGERPEVRNCRFDNVVDDDDGNNRIITKSAGVVGETVIYPGSAEPKRLTPEQMIELQRMIIGD